MGEELWQGGLEMDIENSRLTPQNGTGDLHGGARGADGGVEVASAGDMSCGPESATEYVHPCHPHVPSPSVPGARVCVGSSFGVGGAPGWAVGRLSARLSSRWCCPGCGLFGDGTLCMTCDVHDSVNSCKESDSNLRMGRSGRHRGGTKTLKVCAGIKVGPRSLDNPSGNASLADYLGSAPTSWPIEAWECRTIVYPRVVKEVFLVAEGCEVVSARLPQSERYPVSPGPGELLRSGLGWTPLLRSPSSGVWLFRGAIRGGSS